MCLNINIFYFEGSSVPLGKHLSLTKWMRNLFGKKASEQDQHPEDTRDEPPEYSSN